MNPKRQRLLNNKAFKDGPIIYWMQREHRTRDNWALIYAQELAEKNGTSVVVVFSLRKSFPDATERLISFMLDGLKEVESNLIKKQISFYFLSGDPVEKVPEFLAKSGAGALVTDFHSLRTERLWREEIAKTIQIPMYEVDARNIIPCWVVSDKQEYGAYTLRPKYHRQLPVYLEPFPELKTQNIGTKHSIKINWDDIFTKMTLDTSVKKLTWLKAGETAALNTLGTFLSEKLKHYATDRNDPVKDMQSHLSPYLHFGHISAQRVVLEVQKQKNLQASEDAFLEEITVRRELADNFCYYNKQYDSPQGFPAWAKRTLTDHAYDKREHLYSFAQLESAETHDDLWNSAMNEAKKRGIMHGWLRMYWAKKLFEWSKTPEDAMKHAITLMDKWFIDGREPNGFTGIAWSMGGVHDRAWFERPVFGKIRYMSYSGAKKKFDIQKYKEKINNL